MIDAKKSLQGSFLRRKFPARESSIKIAWSALQSGLWEELKHRVLKTDISGMEF
jgi:hypothetical protein